MSVRVLSARRGHANPSWQDTPRRNGTPASTSRRAKQAAAAEIGVAVKAAARASGSRDRSKHSRLVGPHEPQRPSQARLMGLGSRGRVRCGRTAAPTGRAGRCGGRTRPAAKWPHEFSRPWLKSVSTTGWCARTAIAGIADEIVLVERLAGDDEIRQRRLEIAQLGRHRRAQARIDHAALALADSRCAYRCGPGHGRLRRCSCRGAWRRAASAGRVSENFSPIWMPGTDVAIAPSVRRGRRRPASGLGSNVSTWLGPPSIQSRMHDLCRFTGSVAA